MKLLIRYAPFSNFTENRTEHKAEFSLGKEHAVMVMMTTQPGGKKVYFECSTMLQEKQARSIQQMMGKDPRGYDFISFKIRSKRNTESILPIPQGRSFCNWYCDVNCD